MSLALLALPVVLAAAPVCPKIAEPAEGAKLAVVSGQTVTRAEVDAKIGQALCKAQLDHAQKLYELREQATNALVEEKLLAAEAKKRGLKDAAALEAQLAASAPAPTEAMARQLYEENKDRLDGQTYESLRERILGSLAQQAKGQAREALLVTLRAAQKVELLLEPIRYPIEAKGPSRGPDKAPVTVVLFADYQCPYCSRGADTLEEVRKKHPNDLRVVYRDYPLAFHEQAMPSAIVARCAGAQGKFWEMHDRLFAAQRELNESTYLRLASELKLDSAKLEKCRVDPAIAKAIKDDAAAGEAAGVDGTPAFFINGVKRTGAQPAEAFEAVIGPELARRAKK
jgi:protein-disulfide isomerase